MCFCHIHLIKYTAFIKKIKVYDILTIYLGALSQEQSHLPQMLG